MDATAALMFALVFGLTLLPLVIVLPTAPPMYDDARPMPLERAEKPVTPSGRAGWRISLSITRQEAHP